MHCISARRASLASSEPEVRKAWASTVCTGANCASAMEAIYEPDKNPVGRYSMYWCILSQFQGRQFKNLKRTLWASTVCTGAICTSAMEAI
jgi:hypothetical protein